MMKVSRKAFGSFKGEPIALVVLSNGNMEVEILNYGCIIKAINLPDRSGVVRNVVAGFDDLEGYLQEQPFIGCIVGRYANRLAKGRFSLDGENVQLNCNAGNNHLHGGNNGLDKQVWEIMDLGKDDNSAFVSFHHLSPDGAENFPGNLDVKVTYVLTLDGEIAINYEAATDAPTVINLTNHSYFNLSGFEDASILDHELWIDASFYTPKDEESIPFGTIESVANTPLDFMTLKRIGQDIGKITDDAGYDHNYVVNEIKNFRLVSLLKEKGTGIFMETWTDQPGMQVYTSNWMDGALIGSQGVPYGKYCAVALETQHFPDSPNHANFPSTVLRPGEKFTSRTAYKFGVDK